MKAVLKLFNLSCILIISPEPWDVHFVSKHHYAVTLAESGSHVYFLNPPNKSRQQIEIKPTKYTGLWEIDAPQVKKGLRFYPAFTRRRLEQKWLRKVEKLIGKKFTTIWLFENSRFYDMNFAKNRLKIYHQVDSNQDFHIKKAASTADICFCTTGFIKNKLSVFNKSVYKIHHGVSSLQPIKSLTKIQLDDFLKNKINVVLIGNLDIKYLDINILDSLIRKYPHISFHLVGGYNKEGLCYSKCRKLSNIVWWGKVDSGLIPSILSRCDVSLLLYKTESSFDMEQLASPHKLMEYLASGKVTVASYTDEYKEKNYLLEMVDDNNDYLERFDAVINNLTDYNSPEKQRKRNNFAQEHTYEKQLNKIVSYLKQEKLLK